MKTKIKISLFTAIAAIALAFGASAFKSSEKENKKEILSNRYFKFNGGDALLATSYIELTGLTAEDDYNDLGCGGGDETCGIISTAALPAIMTDGDSNGIPDVTGSITTVDTKD